ncbi:hypothetical protein C8Q70DRAFT_586539 [Cubamyces menziesii]|nr:hypothetical protein C8Q70DRAFT_586539 [Cubamyces menziesii]
MDGTPRSVMSTIISHSGSSHRNSTRSCHSRRHCCTLSAAFCALASSQRGEASVPEHERYCDFDRNNMPTAAVAEIGLYPTPAGLRRGARREPASSRLVLMLSLARTTSRNEGARLWHTVRTLANAHALIPFPALRVQRHSLPPALVSPVSSVAPSRPLSAFSRGYRADGLSAVTRPVSRILRRRVSYVCGVIRPWPWLARVVTVLQVRGPGSLGELEVEKPGCGQAARVRLTRCVQGRGRVGAVRLRANSARACRVRNGGGRRGAGR